MGSFGLAELTLMAIGALFVGALVVTVVNVIGRGSRPTPLDRARRVSAERAFVATSTALIVFATAVIVHIRFPLLEAAPFMLGPIAAATTGLAAFLLMPIPTLDGPARRRTAGVEPRHLSTYSTVGQRTTFRVLTALTLVVTLTAGVLSKADVSGRLLCTSLFPAQCLGGGPYLFPGWLFAAPAVIFIVALYALVTVVLQRIVIAPATIWPELSDADTAMRAGAVRFVLRVAGASLGLTAGLFMGMAAFPLLNAPLLDTGLARSVADGISIAGWTLLGICFLILIYALIVAIRAVTGLLRIPRVAAPAAQGAGS